MENVKKEKMIKGYNTQIEVINRYYAGVISNNLKNKIVFKFELKKIIVKIFNFFNVMFILQMRRVNNITISDQARYKANLDKILSV